MNGEKGIIRLEDEVSGEVFAVCNVHVDNQSEAVEPVLDSSRHLFFFTFTPFSIVMIIISEIFFIFWKLFFFA